MKSLAKSPNSRVHMICGSTSEPPTEVIQPCPISLCYDHFCRSNNESVRQRCRLRNLNSPLKPNGIGLHIFRNPHPPALPGMVNSCSIYLRVTRRKVIVYSRGSPNPMIMLWKPYRQKTTLPKMRQRSVSITSPPSIIFPTELPR
jgi:hypothetical protein